MIMVMMLVTMMVIDDDGDDDASPWLETVAALRGPRSPRNFLGPFVGPPLSRKVQNFEF